jgi:hypothetical protein
MPAIARLPSRTGVVADTRAFASAEPRGRPPFRLSHAMRSPAKNSSIGDALCCWGCPRGADDRAPPWLGLSAPHRCPPPPRPAPGAARPVGPPEMVVHSCWLPHYSRRPSAGSFNLTILRLLGALRECEPPVSHLDEERFLRRSTSCLRQSNALSSVPAYLF